MKTIPVFPVPTAARPAAFWIPLISIVIMSVFCWNPAISARLANPAGRDIGSFFSSPLYHSYIAISIGLLFLCPGRQAQTRWWILDVALSSPIVVLGLKALTQLPRPDGIHDGFPSGHTTFSFALAWLVSDAYPALTPLWFALAAGIGWSRIEVNAHFPYQVLIGSIFGSLIGLLITRSQRGILFPRILHR